MQRRYIFYLVLGIFIFICSIEGIKSGWGVLGGDFQSQLLEIIDSETVPIIGLAVGLLATSLVQSSSAVVAGTMASLAGMVASGVPLSTAVSFGIPVVLGANIGTTVTNSIVAIGHCGDEQEFCNAIPGAIIHDIFNILNVTFFFILELTTGLLSSSATFLARSLMGVLKIKAGELATIGFLDVLIEQPLLNPLSAFLTRGFGTFIGGLSLIVLSFAALLGGLNLISKSINHLMDTTSLKDKIFKTLRTPFRSVLVGTSVTWVLQSSSVATSLSLPFLATGTIDLEQMYSYSLGCNIGTTMDLSQIYGYAASGIAGITLGLAHVIINTAGVALWLFTPLREIPLYLAKEIGNRISEPKIAPVILIGYVGVVFFGLPLTVLFLL